MQLSKIKLAGFKSFVDPTSIMLPSNLVAVVGPNGCGKSNIIDAVSWVMGENSPKYLRGEALTDVIFNGSSARKPVGQASVELVFDNQDASLGGEYGKFTEVSIKRTINRDSDSIYSINGVRCRKRDIIDIFLGTGLGPRSYSIIGQNMINRIIEAKPEDLRGYLEEAAGISKYKERRHETELRIRHTKDNLARVNDLRGELEKQLAHLKYQANVAEKFKALKQQERVLRAEYYTIQWRLLDARIVDATLQIQRTETSLEGRQSELGTTERELEQARHEQRAAQDAFQEVQRRYYATGNEITRIEQEVSHQQERQAQWEHDLAQADQDWQSVKDEMDSAEDELREFNQAVEALQPQYQSALNEFTVSQKELSTAEEAMHTWQNRWDEFNQLSAKTAQTAQVEKTHIQHLEQRIAALRRRQEQLESDLGQINFSDLNEEIDAFSKKSYDVSDKVEFQGKKLAEIRREVETIQAAQLDSNNHLDKVRSELQRLRGQQASLEALQQTALGQRDHSTLPWIRERKLEKNSRLAQQIQVEAGWEVASEKVLGFCLQAICVDGFDEVAAHLKQFKSGKLCLFTPNANEQTVKRHHSATLLLDKIKAPCSLASLLAGIYVADNLDEALKLCESLEAHESVVTRDAVWVNRSWLKILREEDPAAGVFQREQELKQLTSRIVELEATQKELERKILDRREQLRALESKRDESQQIYGQLQAQAAQINAEQKMKQARLSELKTQYDRLLKEQNECMHQLKQTESELVQAQSLWEKADKDQATHAKARAGLVEEREKARQEVHELRDMVRVKQQRVHELEMRLQTSRSQVAALKNQIERSKTQMTALNERRMSLKSELSSMPPMETIKKSLDRALDKHVSIEVELNSARISMETLEQDLRRLEEKRQTIERDASKLRASLETFRVEWQGWKVKAETLTEQIKETEFQIEDILKDLPQEVTAEEWHSKLEQMIQRINRLGPINLVAIDEYTTCLERKEYLDRQLEDLNGGLKTLEDAIAKIDKETKMRFKETFDKVNTRFQELFPTIFGGGKANLELTEEDLLAAGVTVMACPPGKRNSSIYLLSGGEKSLTALALVFSIFYLNPAPFCLLDEVDAPLDDANVVRFTRLVRAMADKTQFIFISHNKITIEMGATLLGVTMNEPGVSRMVSVDIEKAVSMAGN